jgi:UDPglucose--hexose-1-phosphate uridylyltransferase
MLQLTSPRREEDKLKYLAGSEAAMGAFIADIPPETAAARLREAIEKADLEPPGTDRPRQPVTDQPATEPPLTEQPLGEQETARP